MPKASRNPTQRPKQRTRTDTETSTSTTGRDRAERVLSIAVVACIALAVLGFAATLAHVAFRDTVPLLASAMWQYAYWLPLVALPAAIVCLVVLVIVSARGKARRR